MKAARRGSSSSTIILSCPDKIGPVHAVREYTAACKRGRVLSPRTEGQGEVVESAPPLSAEQAWSPSNVKTRVGEVE